MRRRVSRRNILAASGAVGLGAAGLALVGCGDDDDDDSAAVAQTEEATPPTEQTPAEQTPTEQTPTEQTPTEQTPVEQTPVEQTPVEEGFADSTPEAVPPRSSKDIAVLAISATPIAVDPDFGHGSPATWESWMNLLDQTIKFGWRDYPFDVGSVENVGYISFENDDLLPWMQESWELSEDQASLVINIRPGVLSSTGNELTAADFAYRIDRAFALGAIGAFFMNTITVDPSNPYEILDTYQIKVNSTGPNGLLLPIWANSAWQVVDATEALANATDDDEWSVEWMAQNNVGFGGIAVETFGTGERVSFTANKNYFRGEQPIKTIVYEEVPQASNRLAAVERGEADAAYGLPGELFLQAQPKRSRIDRGQGEPDLLRLHERAARAVARPADAAGDELGGSAAGDPGHRLRELGRAVDHGHDLDLPGRGRVRGAMGRGPPTSPRRRSCLTRRAKPTASTSRLTTTPRWRSTSAWAC